MALRRSPDRDREEGVRRSSRSRAAAARRRSIARRRQGAARRTRRRVGSSRDYQRAASARLSRFRQGSLLAVAITGLALMLWGPPDATGQDTVLPAAELQADTAPAAQTGTSEADTASAEAARGAREASQTIRDLWIGGYALLPKVGIAILILVLAAGLSRLFRTGLRRGLRVWERAEAISALAGVLIWLLALGAALSVIAGDARALIGSVGLFGLALSWALQGPIESFSGWLLNSFRGYYRVGDRIAVGDVFGDVYRIDFLTTTVWEAGGPNNPVQGAQPTGAMITFPNSEVLRSNITNFTYDFPFVFDEVSVGVANESDLAYAIRVTRETATEVVGEVMAEPARTYAALLSKARLDGEIALEPQVFVSTSDAWTNLTVRYLVPARERRKWSTELLIALAQEHARPEHAGRIIPSYPVTRVELKDRPTHVVEDTP